MFKTIIKKILPFTIIIGVIAIIPIIVFNTDSISIVTHRTTQIGTYTWNYYYIDIRIYLANLENSLTSIAFTEGIPTDYPQLPQITINDPLDFLSMIANIVLIYVTNWIIFILNCIILMPIKLLLYPINFIAAVLGYNTMDYGYMNFINQLYRFNMKPIPYI